MYTVPTVISSDDLSKRAYVTFYLDNLRVREYNGNSLRLRINPNRAKSLEEREKLLVQLCFELHKALDAGNYPATKVVIESSIVGPFAQEAKEAGALRLLYEVVRTKLQSDLSRTYKRDLKSIYRQFRDFMLPEERVNSIASIPVSRVNKFLSRYGSSGTYYMNKRRNLSVLFTGAGGLVDQPVKTVKQTNRRKAKAKLHKPYEREQLRPILDYLKVRYPNLYICCLLTYGAWLRPHEEIRLLVRDNFKKDCTEVHLSGDENKGGAVRVVYVPEYVRVEIEPIISTLSRGDNIISRRSDPYNDYYFNTQWSRAWEAMNKLNLVYEDQTIYSFRHTAAIEVYRRTKDVYLLQKLLGHSSIVVTLKYLRSLGELNSEQLRDAAPTL